MSLVLSGLTITPNNNINKIIIIVFTISQSWICSVWTVAFRVSGVDHLNIDMCAQKLGFWKILIFFSETERARKGALLQLVGNRGLWEPQHTHYSLQYGDKRGRKKSGYQTSIIFVLQKQIATYLFDRGRIWRWDTFWSFEDWLENLSVCSLADL